MSQSQCRCVSVNSQKRMIQSQNGLQLDPSSYQETSPFLLLEQFIIHQKITQQQVHHIQTSHECILQKHPKAGIILAGDMNHLKTSALTSGFHLKQIVDVPTRAKNNLDKILTNIRKYYSNPFTIGKLGTSDHDVVVAVPSLPKSANHLRRSLSQIELLVMTKDAQLLMPYEKLSGMKCTHVLHPRGMSTFC